MTLTRRWTLPMVLVVALGGAVELALSLGITFMAADREANSWLLRAHRANATPRIQGLYTQLEHMARLAAIDHDLLETLQAGRATVLPEAYGNSFWSVIGADGQRLSGTDLPCAAVLVRLAQRTTPAMPRRLGIACDRVPVVAVSSMLEHAPGQVLIVGVRLDQWFVDAVAQVSGAEVSLHDATGLVVSSLRDRHHQPLGQLPQSRWATHPLGSGEEFETEELRLPGYAGFTASDGQRTEAESFKAYVLRASVPGLEAVPLWISYVMPVSAMRGGVMPNVVLMIAGTLLIMVALAYVLWRLSESFTKPVAELARATEQVADGDLSIQVTPDGPPEISRLAERFNFMTCKLREARDHAVQSAKMAAIGQLAGGIAHEINNPLGVILGFSQGLDRRTREGDPIKLPVSSIVREALRCKALVQELLTFSRTGKRTSEPLDLPELIRATMPLLEARARTQGVEVVAELAPQLPKINGNRTQLQQILVNLGTNALDAMKTGGTLVYRLQPERSSVLLEVADTGTGIPLEVQERIFEPFFTTKGVGEGTGLGLSLVYEMVQQHGGTIQVHSAPGEGTKMQIRMPMPQVTA